VPTVIDSLVLEFSLDPTKFTQGQRAVMQSLQQLSNAAHSQGNDVEASAKRTQNLISGVKREAIGLLALFFGARGIKDFVGNITLFDAALGRNAKTLDMNAGALAAWIGVARQTGGTAESITGSMQGLTDQLNRAEQTGEWGNLLQVFSSLSISVRDANGHFKTAGQLLLDINHAVQGMDAARARSRLQMLGIDPATINTLLLPPLDALLERQEKIGHATQADADAAIELQKAWEQTGQAATTFGQKIMTGLTPILTTALSVVSSFFEKINNPDTSGTNIAELSSGEFYMADTGGPAVGGPGAGRGSASSDANRTNFLSALSFLESSQRGGGNDGSTANGYFQFLRGTAAKARRAGIRDPRFGNYQNQAAATWEYIQRFYPDAAAAVERGDFTTAAAMLKGEWPSLPGGQQPQSPARMATYLEELRGGGPRPGAGAVASAGAGPAVSTRTSTSSTSVGQVNVHLHGPQDADSIARSISPAIQRTGLAVQANTGPQ
jgi:hypothetical protein